MKKNGENRTTEKRIKNAIDAAAPNAFERVADDVKKQTGVDSGISVVPTNRMIGRRVISRIIAAAAAFAIMFTCIYSLMRRDAEKIYATVLIDVNPSIEINVDKKDRVVSVIPRNEDAMLVIDGLDFSGSTVEVAVNAIVGSMLKCGYLNNDNIEGIINSILISVESTDENSSHRLQEMLTGEINSVLNKFSVDGIVLTQSIDKTNDSLGELAEKYGITQSKAQFIQSILDSGLDYDFSSLIGLSISELNTILTQSVTPAPNMDSAQIISQEEARNIAFAHAGVSDKDVIDFEIELDSENGVTYYEIDFDTVDFEFEYDINAQTGVIIKSEKEAVKENNGGTTNIISFDEAKSIALNHAKVDASSLIDFDIDLESKNGITYYEIEFETVNCEYEYDINAETGEIIWFEWDNSDSFTPAPVSSSAPSVISRDEAKNIAFNHAGVDESLVTECEIELDDDDGKLIYEVEFETAEYEFEYDIDAKTGKIIKSEREKKEDEDFIGDIISEDEAKRIAFNHAGIKASEAEDIEIEIDFDDGQVMYSVEFSIGELEFEYKIEAYSGSILEFEID